MKGNVKRGLDVRSIIILNLKKGGLRVREVAHVAGLSYASTYLQLRNLKDEGIVEGKGKQPYRWRLAGRGQSSMTEYF